MRYRAALLCVRKSFKTRVISMRSLEDRGPSTLQQCDDGAIPGEMNSHMNSIEDFMGARRSRRPILAARIARALRRLVRVRGWQSLINTLVPAHSAPFVVHNGDTTFAGDIGSLIDRQVYLFGGYDLPAIKRFIANIALDRRGLALDIGANVGTHSLAFARVFKAVHAFEPNPMLWGQFERNMGLNQLTNVHLHKLGLADRDAELTLNLIDKPNFGLGTFSTVEQYDLPLRPVARCTVRHAGRYLAQIGANCVDAVKIDVQGFESEVLCGLGDILRRDRPVLWLEIGSGARTQLATFADLSALVPFEFRCFQFQTEARWLLKSAELRERDGELSRGDFLLIPK